MAKTKVAIDMIDGLADLSGIPADLEAEVDRATAAEGVLTAALAAEVATRTTLSSTVSAHTANTSNPHSVTKAQIGLGSADNTADADKPISTATQTALDLKAPLANPTFTGSVLVPSPASDDDSQKAAPTSWVLGKIAASTSGVSSVNGRTGTVTLTSTDVGLANVTNVDTANANNISSGTLAAARGGAGTVSGIMKANGSGVVSAAASGTDYQAPIGTISGLAKGNGANALTAATAGTDYVVPGGALGTPSSGTLTNATGLPISTGVSGLGTNVAAFLATPSSANLAAALTDETGSGASVFAISPTLVTPALGTPSALVLTNATGLPTAGHVDASVTYAKIQNISATSRLLGRKTAGAGVTEELTLSQTLDFVGSAAQGDILYRGASTWTRLGAGTSGQFLKTQGTGANPVWAAAGGGLSFLASLTASNSATLDDTTHITSTYDAYWLVFENIIGASSSNLRMQVSTNAGSTWKSTGYETPSTTTTSLDLCSDVRSTSLYGASGYGLFTNPNSSAYKHLMTTFVFKGNSNSTIENRGGIYSGDTTAVNGFRFLMASGNIASGKIYIYGVAKS